MTHPSTCTGKEETIFQYLDGDLPPAERAALEQHLAQCGACREYLAATETLFTDLSTLADVPAPTAEITAAVMAQLPRQTAPSPAERWLPAAQLAVGLALLAMSVPKMWREPAWTFALPLWSPPAALPWLSLVERLRLPTGWLAAGWEQFWTRLSGASLLQLSPSLVWGAIIFLGMAWLASNALLLNPKHSPSLKNGGTL